MALPLVDDYGIPVGPEGDAAHKAAVDALRMTANAGISMPLTLVAPDPKLPGALGYVPFAGNVESILGLGDYLGTRGAALANAGLDVTGASKWGLHVPDPPEFMKTAGQHFAENQAEVQKGIDKYSGGLFTAPDETTGGQLANIVGSAVGGGVGFAPGGAVNAITSVVPRGLKTATSMLIPSVEHAAVNVPVSTALGTTLGVTDAMLSSSPANAATPTPDAQTPSLFAPPAQAAPPAVAVPTQPAPSLFGGVPAQDGTPSLFGDTPPGPTFTQQGSTDMPLWKAGLGLAIGLGGLWAAGRFTHTVGAEISTAARDARLQDPAYAAQVQAHTDDVISRGPGSGTLLPPGGTPTPAPMPQGGAVRRGVTNVAGAVTNEVAPLQNVINMTASDPSMAERLSATMGNRFDNQYMQNRTTNFLATGHDPVTGMTMPSMKGLNDDRARASSDDQVTLAEGLRARNEIQNRTNNEVAYRAANGGADPSLADIAHDFPGKGTDELHGFVEKMMANPVTAEMATRFKAITDGTVDMGEHPNYGFFSADEANRLKTQRSFYTPEMDINQKSMHPFGPRDTSMYTGQAQIMSDPVRDLAQHIEQLYPQFEINRSNQELRTHFLDWQKAPGAPQMMTDVQAPTGAHASYYSGMPEVGGQARDPIVVVRTSAGVKYMRVDDPIAYNAMKNQSLGGARVNLGAMNTAKRLFTQFTTGLGSTITGRIIPLKTAIRSSMVAPVNLPENVRGGLLDTALQKVSPGGVANPVLQKVARGLDVPLNIPAAGARYFMGVGDRRIRDFAHTFAPGADNIANKWLRAIAQDPVVDALHQTAHDWWQASATRRIKENLGISGVGSPMQLNPGGMVVGTPGGPHGQGVEGIRSLSASLSPKAYFANDWGGTKPFFINLRNVFGEALNNIGDAGHDYIAHLNLGNPNVSPEALTYEVRKMYGNPSRSGSSAVARAASAYVPWANISMQELGSTARALGRNPFGAATTLATGMGSLALLQILTHMRSQQHMDYLQNQISLQQREANIILALNSDPNKPTVIPLPYSLRVPNAFMLDVMSKVVNLAAARHDPISFNGVWEGLKDFFGSHITTSDAQAMVHGGADMFDFINPPPMLGHIDYHAMYQNGLANLPSAFHPSTSGPVDRTLPGQAPGIMDTKTSELFRNLLSNTFGAAAATIFDTVDGAARNHAQGHSFLDTIGMAGRDWLQQTKESNLSMNNLLFETPLRLSKMPPIAESLEPTLLNLKGLPPVQQPSQVGLTTRGRGQLPVPVTGEPPVSSDPMVSHMLQVTHGYKSRIDAAMAPINAIKQQMGAVEKYGMDPQQKREWLNQRTRDMADRYKLVQAYTEDMYHTLSGFAGVPITDLGQIKWRQGREQFAN